MLGFLVSLHDIGKFSRPFQAKQPTCWPAALGPMTGEPPGPPHDIVGAGLLRDLVPTRAAALLPPRLGRGQPGWNAGDMLHLWRALAGHHGRPPVVEERLSAAVACAACLEAAGQFVDAMQQVFRPLPWTRPAEQEVIRLSWRLAGLTTLADWVGSRQAWFPYVSATDVADPARYFWGHALSRAAAALAAAGLAHAAPAPFTGIRGLFPKIETSTPVQDWAANVKLPPGPVLAVIEDLTGSGKTEAAVTLAHRLLADGQAEGVYLALPTMATANAMFRRMAKAYRGLFAADGHPSIALAHGRADLNAGFVAAIDGDGTAMGRNLHPADEPAEAHCSAWLALDRRRALLAHVGVGTLDQALLAVLPTRHATLRLHGIAGKVLVVDEVHAFDQYMREELAGLLRFQAALGGSAILLSATLPKLLRQQLVNAFRDGLGAPKAALASVAYPLATLASAGLPTETHCEPREGLPRRVNVTRLEDASAAVERIVTAARAGAAVAWVRNTVDDAIAAAALLREVGIDPLLFHARFAMADRLTIENIVLDRFGPGAGSGRAGVLVATQVIEQSLDIDFDVMVTDLAPADLLIQRAGRLHRHDRGERGVPELLVVSPAPSDDPKPDWIKAVLPGTAAVYRDHALLWRSARAVFGRGMIVTPDDMRPVIEEAFEGAAPPGLAASADQAEGKDISHAAQARQNVLEFWKGYAAEAGKWEPDVDTPTRLEDRPHGTLRLALLRDGAVVPYAPDADLSLAWSQSEVSVAQHRIAACPMPAAWSASADAAKRQWGRWERDSDKVTLALLFPDGDGYRLDARAESGAVVAARYCARTGLSWPGDAPASAG